TSTSSRQVADILANDFPATSKSTVFLIADAPADASVQVTALVDQLTALPAVTGATATPAGSDHWRIDVNTRDGGLAASTLDVVKGIRSLQSPLNVEVGGSNASLLHLQSSLRAHLPRAIPIVDT